MIRKIIILLAAIMLIGTMLTACGDDEKKTDNTQNTPTQMVVPAQQGQGQWKINQNGGAEQRQQGDGVDSINPDLVNPDGTVG